MLLLIILPLSAGLVPKSVAWLAHKIGGGKNMANRFEELTTHSIVGMRNFRQHPITLQEVVDSITLTGAFLKGYEQVDTAHIEQTIAILTESDPEVSAVYKTTVADMEKAVKDNPAGLTDYVPDVFRHREVRGVISALGLYAKEMPKSKALLSKTADDMRRYWLS
jgi:hypothetical protein